MPKKYLITLCLSMSLLSDLSFCETYSSGVSQVALLELYTSEGCSSCPPADRWLSKLKSVEGLWEKFVPIAFHVDYWNNLGWRDRFSKASFSERQRAHRQQGNISSVYTPGFIFNGSEWRGWFRKQALPSTANRVGDLTLSIDEGRISGRFEPQAAGKEALELHVAILGMNRSTDVKRGENHGRLLRHEFIVLETIKLEQTERLSWEGKLPAISEGKEHAVAAWLTQKNDLSPIQAVGGYLKIR